VAFSEVFVFLAFRGGLVGDVVIRAASDECHIAGGELNR
jgi:hypothetical protein